MIKKIQTYFLFVFLLSLFGSVGIAFAAEYSVWMVEVEDTYTYQVTYINSEDDIDIKGEVDIIIEDIDSGGVLTYSIDYNRGLEGNSDWLNSEDDDNVETELNVMLGEYPVIIIEDLYDCLNFTGWYDAMEEEIEDANADGWDLTISGSSDEKSYDFTISGKDGSDEDIMLSQKLEWASDGVLQELSDISKITEGDVEYEYEITIKLGSSSISGFSLGFFSIAMVVGVTSLLLLRKRTN